MKVTVLGCSGSLGVPSLGIGWGDCDPAEPRNRRTRASILISHEGFNLLVDSGPDVRQQLLREDAGNIDAVFYTHEHADHTHGIDDLRGFTLMKGGRRIIPAYGDLKTLAELEHRFGYLFTRGTDGNEHDRKTGIEPRIIEPTGDLQIGPLALRTFQQAHGRGTSLGLRIGNFAYSTDVSQLSDEALAILDGAETWVIDCNNRTPDDGPKHLDLASTLALIERVGAKQAYLTHLPAWWDYQALKAQCLGHVEPAYDGLRLRINT